jgi:SOS-response transcriptional repressor LexA
LVILDDPALSLDDAHKARLVNKIVGPIVGEQQVVLATHYQRFYELSRRVFVNSTILEMVPRRGNNEVCFEAGDLLERVKSAFEESPGIWKDLAGSLRTWIEKSMEVLNGYSPIPFRRKDDLVGSIRDYSNIDDPRIRGENQKLIVDILTRDFIEEIRRLCHDEEAQPEEFEDALNKLMECKKYVDKEIGRLKKHYQADLDALSIRAGLQIEMLNHRLPRVETTVRIVREAAAAHNAQGIEWELNDEYRLEGCPVVLLCSDVIAPIGLVGQYLILDWEDRKPKNEDFVVVKTDDEKRYVRRIWFEEDGAIVLEGANPTKPFMPVRIDSGECKVRRIVGVLYSKVDVSIKPVGEEWVTDVLPDGWFDNTAGVRVGGTSLEPLARNRQIILIEKRDVREEISNDMLACVSMGDEGDFIKRCYLNGSQCVLSAINPTEREMPMVVDLQSIQSVYPLKGVLFEVGSGTSQE